MVYLNGTSRDLIKAAANAPYLEREEEKQIALAWQEGKDRAALEKLVWAHLRLAIAIAVRFRHYGLPVADLVQEGNVGLMQAANRFDATRNVRFSTYATWWIKAAMQDYILRNWSIVRGGTSSSQKMLFFKLRRLRAKLERQGNELSRDVIRSIAKATGSALGEAEVMYVRLSGPDISLDKEIMAGTESATRMDLLVDGNPLPDEIVEKTVDDDRRTRTLQEALAVLDPRELRIVREHQLSDPIVTLESLGMAFGISKERVRQIEVRALVKLRCQLVRSGVMS